MFRLGEYQDLIIDSIEPQGVYLVPEGSFSGKLSFPKSSYNRISRVLLPGIECDGNEKPGDAVDAFIYLDSEDRLIATKKRPQITLGEVAPLQIKEMTKIGAFLEWGLPRDVLLPFKEMIGKPKVGQTILVRLYIDKTKRLAVSMKKLYPLLRKDSPFAIGETVEGRIYEFGHDFGTFVAVNDLFSAMIPRHEDVSAYRIGDVVDARIAGIKPDGKIDLTLRKKKEDQLTLDADTVMEVLKSYAGVLPFTEKAESAVIKRETGLSKAAFKRAVGHLYKEKKVTISEEGRVRLNQ